LSGRDVLDPPKREAHSDGQQQDDDREAHESVDSEPARSREQVSKAVHDDGPLQFAVLGQRRRTQAARPWTRSWGKPPS
jgi:hypothetical protein